MPKLHMGAAVLAAALLAAPAAADWLVTSEGGRVETRGHWTVKGKLVVFTKVDGQLSSLRLSEVNLAASEQATADAVLKAKEAAEAKPAPPPEKKESRWVMTDKDFKPAPPPAPKEEEKKPAAPETDEAGRPRLEVVVDTWERRNIPDGLEIAGTLRNSADEIAAEAGVTVRLYDDAGGLLATGEGRIATPAIAPGGSVPFRVAFPGIFSFAEAKFETRGFGLRLKAAPPGAKEGDEPKPEAKASPDTAAPPPGRVP